MISKKQNKQTNREKVQKGYSMCYLDIAQAWQISENPFLLVIEFLFLFELLNLLYN